eukprot:7382841-Prymnesium_polylepis.1
MAVGRHSTRGCVVRYAGRWDSTQLSSAATHEGVEEGHMLVNGPVGRRRLEPKPEWASAEDVRDPSGLEHT